MVIREVFATDATVAQLADWVELDHFLSGRLRSTDSRVVRADSVFEEEPDRGVYRDEEADELVEREITDGELERRRDLIAEELMLRQNALEDLYPFSLSMTISGGYRLTNRGASDSRSHRAQIAYLALLVMSGFRHRMFVRPEPVSAQYAALVSAIPHLFQGIATCAAQNLLGPGSEVRWFGFPRPEHSAFLVALKDLVAQIGHGLLKDKPPYNTGYDKDATIDIVAWRPFADGTYGSLLVFGQAASGNNWTQKPVRTYIKGRFFDHFIDWPASQYLGATFIPFVMHTEVKEPSDGNYQGALIDNARQAELTHGLLIDRLRIVDLVGRPSKDEERIKSVANSFWSPAAVARWMLSVRKISA